MKCFIIHEKVLPSLRFYLAKKMYEKGFSQTEIAKKLKISQANVSYYIHNKRVKNKVKIPEEILEKMIEDLKEKNLYEIICSYCPVLLSSVKDT